MLDEFFMNMALEEARIAFSKGEVPVGAVLVSNGEVIAKAHNLVETLQDATAHAEVLCLRYASSKLSNWRLVDTILYTTLEPCCMCAGAMILSRVEAVVWAAPDIRQGACGSWVHILDSTHPIHNLKIRSGVFANESSKLMKDFFKQRREEGGLNGKII